ncbi:MAG: hypothetical protein OXT09_22200 [Myxococcales bacterium]|nr:hypothetical protein [Myxococcales bacterium]
MWPRSRASVVSACLAIAGSLVTGCEDQYAAVGAETLEEAASGRVDTMEPLGIDSGAAPSGTDAGPAAPDAGDHAADVQDGGLGAAADASAACEHPAIGVCDPVANTGCPPELGMQCAVDLANTLAGYCIFASPPTILPCLNTLVTESCAAGSACVDGECRRLCFCDSECEAGQCCNGPIAAHGFSACGDC